MGLEWWNGPDLCIPFEEWQKHRHYRCDKWFKKLLYLFIFPAIRDGYKDLKELRIIREAYEKKLADKLKELEERAMEAIK